MKPPSGNLRQSPLAECRLKATKDCTYIRNEKEKSNKRKYGARFSQRDWIYQSDDAVGHVGPWAFRKSWENIAQPVIGVMIDHGSEDCPIWSTPNRWCWSVCDRRNHRVVIAPSMILFADLVPNYDCLSTKPSSHVAGPECRRQVLGSRVPNRRPRRQVDASLPVSP
jgi:hypothetical protein